MLHLLRPIGEGGMGKVWVAQHKGLDTEVVVKFLATDISDRKDAEARFAREAAAAAAVKSPHVVQVFDHGITPDGVRYIVMEHLEGRDLATQLAQAGPMAPADIAAVAMQVAKALAKAHQAGVIHRDIKPENIFLCDGEAGDMFVKVLDFGVAKREQQMTAKTSTGQIVGTPFYMSPEQILGEQLDGRADIWSLGVVVFEALTGRRPFDGPTVGSVTLAIHRQPPKPSDVLPSLPPAIDEWFLKACARLPMDRFANAREAANALLAAVGEAGAAPTVRTSAFSLPDASEPLLAAAESKPDVTSRSVTSLSSSFATPSVRRRTPTILLAGAGVVIAVLGILAVVAIARGPDGATKTAVEPASSAAGSASLASATTAPDPAPPSATTPASPPSSSANPANPPGSAERPVVSTTPPSHARTPSTARPGATTTSKGSGRPPRRPNDDDIK